ncbi:hypothetical protein BD413DRAFT_609561 [Trametes elegans]|nr:hypothetical protein BD413DRAFT_609561 [Trametes elegans]
MFGFKHVHVYYTPPPAHAPATPMTEEVDLEAPLALFKSLPAALPPLPEARATYLAGVLALLGVVVAYYAVGLAVDLYEAVAPVLRAEKRTARVVRSASFGGSSTALKDCAPLVREDADTAGAPCPLARDKLELSSASEAADLSDSSGGSEPQSDADLQEIFVLPQGTETPTTAPLAETGETVQDAPGEPLSPWPPFHHVVVPDLDDSAVDVRAYLRAHRWASEDAVVYSEPEETLTTGEWVADVMPPPPSLPIRLVVSAPASPDITRSPLLLPTVSSTVLSRSECGDECLPTSAALELQVTLATQCFSADEDDTRSVVSCDDILLSVAEDTTLIGLNVDLVLKDDDASAVAEDTAPARPLDQHEGESASGIPRDSTTNSPAALAANTSDAEATGSSGHQDQETETLDCVSDDEREGPARLRVLKSALRNRSRVRFGPTLSTLDVSLVGAEDDSQDAVDTQHGGGVDVDKAEAEWTSIDHADAELPEGSEYTPTDSEDAQGAASSEFESAKVVETIEEYVPASGGLAISYVLTHNEHGPHIAPAVVVKLASGPEPSDNVSSSTAHAHMESPHLADETELVDTNNDVEDGLLQGGTVIPAELFTLCTPEPTSSLLAAASALEPASDDIPCEATSFTIPIHPAPSPAAEELPPTSEDNPSIATPIHTALDEPDLPIPAAPAPTPELASSPHFTTAPAPAPLHAAVVPPAHTAPSAPVPIPAPVPSHVSPPASARPAPTQDSAQVPTPAPRPRAHSPSHPNWALAPAAPPKCTPGPKPKLEATLVLKLEPEPTPTVKLPGRPALELTAESAPQPKAGPQPTPTPQPQPKAKSQPKAKADPAQVKGQDKAHAKAKANAAAAQEKGKKDKGPKAGAGSSKPATPVGDGTGTVLHWVSRDPKAWDAIGELEGPWQEAGSRRLSARIGA